MSGEAPQTARLSRDLRRRIVHAAEKGTSVRQIAARYEVGPSAPVRRTRRVCETGSVMPDRIEGHRRTILLPREALLREQVEARSGITLAEIQVELLLTVTIEQCSGKTVPECPVIDILSSRPDRQSM